MFDNFLNKMTKGVTVVFYTICILTFFNTCNSCNRNRNEKNIMKYIDSVKIENVVLRNKIDSISSNMITPIDLQIEGLKSEKRMIQSCDRKIWDLGRQTKIDVTLDSLNRVKYSK